MDVLQQIEIPYGKKYHLFLSFCNEDEETAETLLKELEESYKLKCFYHIRDFIPGVSITENILDGIKKSIKIVYLVSQKFKENDMCKREVLYGIQESHTQGENNMIPVLLEDIVMPRELQTITYVNATLEGTDVPRKIYKACLFGARTDCILPIVIPFQEMHNGTPLRVFHSVQSWKWWIPVIRFREDEESRKNISDEDRSRKIEELCTRILEDLNSSKFVTRYFLQSRQFLFKALCFFATGLPSLVVLPFLAYLITEKKIASETRLVLSFTLGPGTLLAVLIIYGIYRCRSTTESGADLESIVWKYLVDNYKTLKVLPLLRSTKEIVLLNYDTEGCKECCIFALKMKMSDEDEIERKAEKMILDHIQENRRVLAQWYTLPDYKSNRHNTYAQKKCICQSLQSRFGWNLCY